jgi:tRNA (guanine37-N1)-methyltransferase
MRLDVITLFPDMFRALTDFGVTGKALQKGIWHFKAWNPRQFVLDAHRTVDDRPYGGGAGMVMLAEPLSLAIKAAKEAQFNKPTYVVYLSPQGKLLDQKKVIELSKIPSLILLCGRYEGVDERLIAQAVDEEISVGDYVLSGGELPAMVLMDSLLRLLPGVLNDQASCKQDSFMNGLLDYPHYTRPEEFLGMKVPTVLSSGHHGRIAIWRLKQSLGRTWCRRPDLLDRRLLTTQERELLAEFQQEQISL